MRHPGTLHGRRMLKHIWLKLLLVLHFLPWPGSDLIYSAVIFADSMAVQNIQENAGSDEESSSRKPLIVYHSGTSGDPAPVYCETVGEAKELESESKEGRDDDSQDLCFESWSSLMQQIATLVGSTGFQSEWTLYDSKHQSFVILRC